MIDRINLILKAKNITARQFAEEIGIQPSGMSHILSGRNNPSLDFVMKVVRRYPEIDINWLLMGRGEMYGGAVGRATEVTAVARQSVGAEPTLFSDADVLPSAVQMESAVAEVSPASRQEGPSVVGAVQASAGAEGLLAHDGQPSERRSVEVALTTGPETVPGDRVVAGARADRQPEGLLSESGEQKEKPSPVENEGRRLVKILFFYDDRTFAEYRPL